VHAADLHLDAPFAGVDASDARVRAGLVASTAEAFERVVSLCIAEDVDFLLISGDVYDDPRSFNAQLCFQQQTKRLDDADIDVFVVEGNHDPEIARPRDLRLPDNVHYFSTREVERVVVERDGEEFCTLYGRGYARGVETADLAKDFARSGEDAVAIGVLHTNVGGREGFEDYAPASMDDLRAARMDYWALGHIHKPEVLSESPAIVYAGCPQGRSPKEDGVRGCYLVKIDGGHAEFSFHPTCSIVWVRRTVDASDLETVEDVRGAVRDACDAARLAADGRPAILRIELTGRTEAHRSLVRGTVLPDLLRDARDEQMSDRPWVWIERLTDKTAAALEIERLRESQDFDGDLVRLTDELVADPAALRAEIAGILRPVESSVGAVELSLSDEELLARARDICLDRLEGEAR
jgi:DNA repair exonuclease SbcCD nuclease subunit